MWFLIPFVLWPIVEIALFVQIGGAIGVGATILWVLLSGALGLWVMRRQGAAAMADLQRAVDEFRDPARPIAHGALVMLGGGLLLLPGFLTDALGLLLLIPPVRSLLLRALGRRVRVASAGFGTGRHGTPRGRATVIDAEYVVIEEEPDEPPPPLPPSAPPRGPRRPSGWTQH